jgi:hypothetical protein
LDSQELHPIDYLGRFIVLKLSLITAIVLLLIGGVSVAQTNPVPVQNSTATVTPVSHDTGIPRISTPEDQVVITVDVCDPPAASACQTRLTREQFEKRYRTISAGPKRPNERPINANLHAEQYVRALAYTYEAKKEGLEADPEFQQQMRAVEMQLLSTALQKKLKAETANPPEQVLQDYYDKISKRYEELTIRSVFIPRPPRSKAAAQSTGTPAGEAPWPEGEDVATQKLGDEARRQMAAGEDPEKVQQTVWAATKSTGQPPSTQPTRWRRNPVVPAIEETMLFGLRPGEVSPPVPNGSGLTVYRLESKRKIPLAEVEREVAAVYQMDQVQKRLDSFVDNAHAVLDKQYFDEQKEAEIKAQELEKQREERAEKGVPSDSKAH